MNNSISRRHFLGTTALAAAGLTIIPRRVMGMGSVAPSDRLTIAQCGCGMQGFAELGPLVSSEDLQFVAVCDPVKDGSDYVAFGNGTSKPTSTLNIIRGLSGNSNWRPNINYVPGGREVMKETIEGFYTNERYNETFTGVKAYEDFREMLEKEDVDIVKCITPDHLHATIVIAAMKKGINVITHKPLSNRLYESDLVIKTAKETGVASYFMPYNNYDDLSHLKTWIDDGLIGDLKSIHEWSNRPMWKQFTEIPQDRPPIPANFNWDLWLGPEKDRPYNPCYTHTLFRGWYDFGGGSFADMGHYSWWAVCDFFDLDVPAFSEGFGNNAGTVSYYEGYQTGSAVNDQAFPLACTMRVHYNAKGKRGPVDVVWYDGGMKPAMIPELDELGESLPGSSMMYVGTKGVLICNSNGGNVRILPEKNLSKYRGTKPEPIQQRGMGVGGGARTYAYTTKGGYGIGNLPPKFDQFIAACRGGSKDTPGNFQSAEALSTLINLGIVGLRAKSRVDFDPVTRRITNNEEANKFLTRDYRPGWELK